MLAMFIACAISVNAQVMDGTYYVAAKSGLSMRDKPDANAKVLEKISYGTKVTTIAEDGDWKEITTESMMGHWKKVKFNNKTGYIVDNYLLPWAPPKLAGIKDLKQYLAQVSLPHGTKLIVKSGNMTQLTESGWELNKQLYKNGAEWHEYFAYEYGSDTYFLPNFSLQQGFLLLRLIPEFKDIFGEKDEFPTTSKKYTKNGIEYELTIVKTIDEPDYTGPYTIEKIKISYTDGASYEFEMYTQDNQLLIFFGSGV
jgi:hypothetical protein